MAKRRKKAKKRKKQKKEEEDKLFVIYGSAPYGEDCKERLLCCN